MDVSELKREKNIMKLQQELDESTANAMKKLHDKAKEVEKSSKNRDKDMVNNQKDMDEKQRKL